MKTSLLFLLPFFISTSLFSAVTFTEAVTAQQLADQIQGVGITITNPTITHGSDKQSGIFFNATDEGLEIDEGILLTCMDVNQSFTTNSSGSTSINASGTHNDADLLAIDTRAFYNPIIFEFDVTLDENTRLLLIDYQFASEEYNEYVGSQFNDTFGFFISGGDLNQTYNIARVVDNQTFVTIDNINDFPPVTVNNVNNGVAGANENGTPFDTTNTAYFIDNTDDHIDIEYDGLTVTLHAALDNLTPGVTYHFKMALADTADSAWDTGVFINKINGLREPSICYDYAYKQNEQYITADYNASTGPVLNAKVIANDTNYPIEVSMYIKNTKDSEIVASNILLDIFDLNTSQAIYKRNSVSVTETGEIYPTTILDSPDLNVSDSYVKGIPITSFNAFEYFYTYFSLDPLETDLNLPISSRITYDLTIPLSATENVVITRSSLIDSDVPICSSSSAYLPVPGIFTLVHNDYYDLDITGGTKPYYNIPTQVTSREGNFKAISLDVNNTNLLVGRSTIASVELVDISAFHDTEASCNEQSNAISERIWITFDNNVTSTMFDKDAINNAIGLNNTITSSDQFYAVAGKNTAFRISYNVTDDGNADLVQVEEDDNTFKILNFSEIVQTVGECGRPVVYPLNATNNGIATRAAQACGNSGNFISYAHLQACMECLYGIKTKFTCSRDNFAIRPEAFLINIDDQNQTDPTNPLTPQERLTTNYSGVASPSPQELNIASGYNYNIEVSATNHLNNTASSGYIKSFASFNTTDTAQYIWEPRDITTANANTFCNDKNDSNITMTFFNGLVDTNTSLDQVGQYKLNILDTSWTYVDSNPDYMTHHNGHNYFLDTNTKDCAFGESHTYEVNSTMDFIDTSTLNGCNISSQHTNFASNLKYNDYNVTFHPYKFGISHNITLGIGNKDINITDDFLNFVYMSNINEANDINMSVQFNSTITAQSYTGTTLNNFVTQCYAKPIDINVSKSAPLNTALTTRYSFYDLNSTGEVNATIAANTIPNQDANVTTTNVFFIKDLNGTMKSTMNINFDRNQSIVANPEDINYSRATVVDPRTLISANLIANYNASGTVAVDQNVTHYFGRTAARKTRIVCDGGNATCSSGLNGEPDVLIYYEAYCFDDTNNNICNRDLIPKATGNRLLQKVDSRWYINLNHKESDDGNLTLTTHTAGTPLVFVPNITISNDFTKDSQHNYAISNGLPYEADMESTVPNWLIYDENNPLATRNPHLVIFQAETTWTGKHDENNVTTVKKTLRRVNRRTMW